MQLRYINPKAPTFADSAGNRSVARMERLSSVPTADNLTLSTFKSEQFNASVMLELGFTSMQGRGDHSYDFYMFAFSFVDPVLRVENVMGIDRAFEFGTSIRSASAWPGPRAPPRSTCPACRPRPPSRA